MKLILMLFVVQFAVALAQSYLDANALSRDSERSRRFVVVNQYPQYNVRLYANENNHSGFVIYGEGYGPNDFPQKTPAPVRTTPRTVTTNYPAVTTKSDSGSPPHFTTPKTSKVSKETFGGTDPYGRDAARTTPSIVTTKYPAYATTSSFDGSPPHHKTTKLSTSGGKKTNDKKTGKTTPRPTPNNKPPDTNLTPPVDCTLCSQYCSAKF